MSTNQTITIKKGDIIKTALELMKEEEFPKDRPEMSLLFIALAGMIEQHLFIDAIEEGEAS